MSPLTAIRNLLFAAETVTEDAVLDTPARGDIVRNADGDLCAIERIGWNGQPSWYYGDDVLSAYVFGFCEDGTVWVDWLPLHTLSTEAVDTKGISHFCDYVVADLVSLRKSFRVVNEAVLDCECE